MSADSARELTARGYRRVSNQHRIISRIDRPDWLEHLAEEYNRPPEDFLQPGKTHGCATWADFYRRVLSKDFITVDEATFKKIPGSGFDPVGFIGDVK